MSGKKQGKRAARAPWRIFVSTGLTPAAATRTSRPSGGRSGSSRSRTRSSAGSPKRSMAAARIPARYPVARGGSVAPVTEPNLRPLEEGIHRDLAGLDYGGYLQLDRLLSA